MHKLSRRVCEHGAEALDTQLATKQDLVELKLDMIKWIVGIGLAQIALLIGILTKV